MSKKLYGFYSAKAVENGCGYNEYLTPDNKLVKVTCVDSLQDVSSWYEWDDVIPVGEVTKCMYSSRDDVHYPFFFNKEIQEFEVFNSK